MCRAVLIEDAAALEALVPAWWELWRRSPAATPFRSPAWLLPWWRAFAPGRLATVAVWAAGRLVALAPSYIETGPLGRRLLPLGIGISDDLDLLADPDLSDAAFSRLSHAVAELDDVDSWEFEELGPEASAWSMPRPPGFEETVTRQSACPVLELAGDDGLACVPSRQRRKLRMAQHRSARRGGEVHAADARDLGGFLDHLCRLHGARWQRRGEGGVLDNDLVQRFHREALPCLVEADLAVLLTLTADARVVGAYYGFRQPGRAYAYLGGFDPEYSFESPGTVLLGYAIADARARGARELHLLRGQEPYKYAWGAADRWNQRRSWRRAVR